MATEEKLAAAEKALEAARNALLRAMSGHGTLGGLQEASRPLVECRARLEKLQAAQRR
jgi:hypothetical protein